MVVVRLGTRVPLRSLALTSTTPFKRVTGKKPICRKLFDTTADEEENLRIAKELLESSASKFVSRWNFDPISEEPLTQGRFSWTPINLKVPLTINVDHKALLEKSLSKEPGPVSPSSSLMDSESTNEKTEREKEEEGASKLLTHQNLTPLIKNLSLRNEICDSFCSLNNQIKLCSCKLKVSEGGSSSSPTATATCGGPHPKIENLVRDKKKLRQTKITEYGRIVKRKTRESLKQVLKTSSSSVRLLM